MRSNAFAHPKTRKVGAWGLRRPRALTTMFSLFWRRPPKKREKGDFVSKSSVLRTREFVEFVRYIKRERASHSARFFARQAILSLPGGMRVHTRGLERPQLARHGYLSSVSTASSRRRPPRPRPLPLQRQHHALFARAPARIEPGRGRCTQAEANAWTAATCVTRTFQSDSPPKSPSSDCISRTTKLRDEANHHLSHRPP